MSTSTLSGNSYRKLDEKCRVILQHSPRLVTRNSYEKKYQLKLRILKMSYLSDDSNDGYVRSDDDHQRNEKTPREHVKDVRPRVLHFRLPINRATAPQAKLLITPVKLIET